LLFIVVLTEIYVVK